MAMSKLSGVLAGIAFMLLAAPAFIAPATPNQSAPTTSVPQVDTEQMGTTSSSSASSVAAVSFGVAALAATILGGRAARRTKAAVAPTAMHGVTERYYSGDFPPVMDDTELMMTCPAEKADLFLDGLEPDMKEFMTYIAAKPYNKDSFEKMKKQMATMPKQLWYTGGPQPYDVWDPLGLSVGASKEQMLRWRHVEIVHSRVAMNACLGWWANTNSWHWIGDAGARLTLSDDPLIAVTQLPMAALWQTMFTIMCIEWLFLYPCKPDPEYPWDYFGMTELITKDGQEMATYKQAQLQELNNGRLSMIAFLGLVGTDIGSGGKNIGSLSGINPFPLNKDMTLLGKPWPSLDPRFDPDDIMAWIGGFNNFILYAKGVNPFADQLV